MVDKTRIRALNDLPHQEGPVIYWMQRDQRVNDNWALLYAQERAMAMKQPLAVVFCLLPQFLDAMIRQYQFMIDGLQEVEKNLGRLAIPFYILQGEPTEMLPRFLEEFKAGSLITDFNPLNIPLSWKKKLSQTLSVPFFEVDAHNIIPCWIASNKQEFGARTLRPKISKIIKDYLVDYPSLLKHPFPLCSPETMLSWNDHSKSLQVDRSVKPVQGFFPGEKAAMDTLDQFLNNRAGEYGTDRNFPEKEGQSGLSPYLHFGQISAQRIGLEIMSRNMVTGSKNAFLEELIVRKELADNYCYYNPNYDRFEGFPAWAQKTLNEHRGDPREYCYSPDQFENAETHDDLWNAAQKEMVKTGKMHGFMRMYWAKKILEWTASPEESQAVAIWLNDKYELDGRDPNGYSGIAWSIGGVHDRPWGRRPVFGMIRYMNYNGCLRKFNVKAYLNKINSVSA
jgi:deoxyribodipyrimidine photo-lyase